MKESLALGGWRRYLCSAKDMLRANKATVQGINLLLTNHSKAESLSMQEAALIANRICEERHLIHRILGRILGSKNAYRHMRRMMNDYIQQRDCLLKLAKEHGLPTELIKGWCRMYMGSATPGVNTITKKGRDNSAQV